jgi:short-subunit dehydrogenase
VQREVAESGVRLQALCPGYTHTEFHARMGVDPAADWGLPEDWWMEAEEVAAASLAALALGEVICVPGLADASLLTQFQQARDRVCEQAITANKPVARYAQPA